MPTSRQLPSRDDDTVTGAPCLGLSLAMAGALWVGLGAALGCLLA
jgi:hypothetical protein